MSKQAVQDMRIMLNAAFPAPNIESAIMSEEEINTRAREAAIASNSRMSERRKAQFRAGKRDGELSAARQALRDSAMPLHLITEDHDEATAAWIMHRAIPNLRAWPDDVKAQVANATLMAVRIMRRGR